MSEDSAADKAPRLSDRPDWTYLLGEIETVYGFGSAGGSEVISAHRRRVREALHAVVEADARQVARVSDPLPVLVHFGRALDRGVDGPLSGMIRALARVADELPWEFGYEDVPEKLTRDLGYCELLGPRGPVYSEELILGLVLLAPHTSYPQHSHEGIEESYLSLSGAWSENDAAVYAPGSLILNRSDEQHRVTVGHPGPCLLLFAWVASPELRQPHTSFPDPHHP
ncbi:MAG: cupin domain-containing protein [Actinobacteria bacterium]|nr:cupin domain-containing protein [Actinomycetota bacterium]